MIRRLLFELFLFLLPFVIYGVYWKFVTSSGGARDDAKHPRVALSLVGLALVIASLIWWELTGVNPTESTYIPPHLEDGAVVPGQFEPTPDQ